jgi:hypothetical protein
MMRSRIGRPVNTASHCRSSFCGVESPMHVQANVAGPKHVAAMPSSESRSNDFTVCCRWGGLTRIRRKFVFKGVKVYVYHGFVEGMAGVNSAPLYQRGAGDGKPNPVNPVGATGWCGDEARESPLSAHPMNLIAASRRRLHSLFQESFARPARTRLPKEGCRRRPCRAVWDLCDTRQGMCDVLKGKCDVF